MKLDVEIDIGEADEILREHLTRKLGSDIGKVSITSHNKAIVFNEDGLVEAAEFRHRIK